MSIVAEYAPQVYHLDHIRPINPEDEMKMLGISSEYELARYQAVSAVAGHEVAIREIQRNARAYEREFLQDIPVGERHTYFHMHDFLYSEQHANTLFQVAAQIDPRERDGATIDGFLKFQESVVQAGEDEVVLWYSPAGIAGTQEPFSKIYFDSGRLYVAYKDGGGRSSHVDIKIDEDRFPLHEFRAWFGEVTLDTPINTKQGRDEFIEALRRFDETHEFVFPAYISQRDSDSATAHYFPHIIYALEQQMKKSQNVHQLPRFFQEAPQRGLSQEDIRKMYLGMIHHHAQGGRVTLYGCSTTSIIETSSSVGQSSGFPGFGSKYSTYARIMGGGVDYKDDPDLCRCRRGDGPHFHCPGKDSDGNKCAHPITVGKGIEKCPKCGEGKRC